MVLEFLIVLCIVSRISTQVGYFIILYHLKKNIRYFISIFDFNDFIIKKTLLFKNKLWQKK